MVYPILMYLRTSTKVAKRRRQQTIEDRGYASFNVLNTTVQAKPVWSAGMRKVPLAAHSHLLLTTGLLLREEQLQEEILKCKHS